MAGASRLVVKRHACHIHLGKEAKKKGSGPMALWLKQEDFSSGAFRDRVSAFDDVVAGGPLELLDQGGFGERRSCNGA